MLIQLKLTVLLFIHIQFQYHVAKRRWVYGQGVLSPEAINSAYGGTLAFIDYPFADYTGNYTLSRLC
jgi:hypothetical protein